MNQIAHYVFNILNTEGFPPRWLCGIWSPFDGWLYIASDIAIWSAYISIPFLLLFFIKKRKDLPFPRIIWLFAAFIFSCGTTHFLDAAMFWWPAYRLSALIKFSTAIVSWCTVQALVRIVPEALNFKSPAQLEQEVQKQTESIRVNEFALKEKLEWEQFLRHLMLISNEQTELPELIQEISQHLQAFLQIDRCIIALPWQHGNEPLTSQSCSEYASAVLSSNQPTDFFNSLVLDARIKTEPVFVGYESQGFPVTYTRFASEHQIKSVIAYEICYKDFSFGILVLHQCQYERQWNRSEIEFLADVAIHLGTLMYQQQLKQQERLAYLQMQESEIRWKQLANSKMMGLIYCSLSGEILDANDTFLEMIGYTREELEAGQLSWRELTPEDQLERTNNNIQKMLNDEPIEKINKQYRHKDGRLIDVLIEAKFFPGSRTHTLCSVLDITSQKHAETALLHAYDDLEKKIESRTEELRLAKEQFQVCVDGAQFGLWDWNIETNQLYTSPKYAELLGYSPAEYQSHNKLFDEDVHPSDYELAMVTLQAHLDSNYPFQLEFRRCKANHEYAWFEIQGQALFDETGKAVRIAGSLSDITKRKDLEDCIENAMMDSIQSKLITENQLFWQQQTNEMINLIRDPEELPRIYGMLVKTICDLLNVERCYLVQFEQDDVLPIQYEYIANSDLKSLLNTLPPWGTCPLLKLCNETAYVFVEDVLSSELVDENLFSFFEALPIRAKAVVPAYQNDEVLLAIVLHSAAPKQWEVNEKNFLIAIAQQLSITLFQEKLRKEALMAAKLKAEFLANMSHEIRTPLNGIIGMTALALETSLTEEQQEYLNMAHSAGNSLIRIINDVLDFSKIEAGKLSLEKIPFNIRQHMNEVIFPFQQQTMQKGLYLTHVVSPDVPQVLLGDIIRIRQILNNLIGNAIKFTEKGGISVGIQVNGEHSLHIWVKDTGIGLSEEQKQYIFDPFIQADSSTTRKFGGTGLGLTITAKLVALMNGSIWVDSEHGLGCTFHCTLAVEAVPSERNSEIDAFTLDVPYSLQAGPSLNILLAEDNSINQRLALRMLEKLGHKVEIAENGKIAVEKAKNCQYDLILMDMLMPEMDGLEATRLIKDWQKEASIDTPVIALTANASEQDQKRCQEAGMIDFLSKPFKKEDLILKMSLAMQSPPAKVEDDYLR